MQLDRVAATHGFAGHSGTISRSDFLPRPAPCARSEASAVPGAMTRSAAAPTLSLRVSLRASRRLAGGAESPALLGIFEQGLRCRVYRLARPRMWERPKLCLDKWGGYHPEWAATFRRARREWMGTDMEVWLEPHLVQATMRRMEEAGLL